MGQLIPFRFHFPVSWHHSEENSRHLSCERNGERHLEIFDGCRRRLHQEWNSGIPGQVRVQIRRPPLPSSCLFSSLDGVRYPHSAARQRPAPESGSAICRGFSEGPSLPDLRIHDRSISDDDFLWRPDLRATLGSSGAEKQSSRFARQESSWVTCTAFALGSVLLLMIGRVLGGDTGGVEQFRWRH